MFHDVGQVDAPAIDPGLFERAIEQPAGGADKGMSGDVLDVARLLPDHHHVRRAGPSPKTVCVARA